MCGRVPAEPHISRNKVREMCLVPVPQAVSKAAGAGRGGGGGGGEEEEAV